MGLLTGMFFEKPSGRETEDHYTLCRKILGKVPLEHLMELQQNPWSDPVKLAFKHEIASRQLLRPAGFVGSIKGLLRPWGGDR